MNIHEYILTRSVDVQREFDNSHPEIQEYIKNNEEVPFEIHQEQVERVGRMKELVLLAKFVEEKIETSQMDEAVNAANDMMGL